MTPPPTTRWPIKVRCRDGRLTAFDPARIEAAVARAAREVRHAEAPLATTVATAVADILARRPRGEVVDVEAIQDLVEAQLAAAGFDDVARAYIIYRQRRADLRSAKDLLGVRDELKLSLAAVTVLRERYLLRDEKGRPTESTGEMMERAATCVAAAEDGYKRGSSAQWAKRFATLLRRLEFLPNSPTLMNAGTKIGLLAGCFVLPVEDSIHSIFTTLGQAAEIHRAGGGTGYSFSRVRPAGDLVSTTGGMASGPLSFLRLYDTAAGIVSLGGRRRGACMAVLDASHPDVYDFVTAKAESLSELTHFNISIGVTDNFLHGVERNGVHRLVNPRTGKSVAEVGAADLFTAICEAAHACGDPGLVFLDTINRANPLPARGRIEATNPCGEVPLLPYESCNLGSINLARMTRDGQVDWDRLAEVARLAVRFLDDVIDVSRYPFPELAEATLATRKIGLGVMGLAEMLASLGIPYDSERGVNLAGRIARCVQQAGHAASARLAEERGAFPALADSRFAAKTPRRNAQVTSVAPTGTISLIAGTTAGIEPMFAIAFVRAILGRQLLEVNPCFDRLARDGGFYRDELATEIAQRGGVRGCSQLPAGVRAAFPTASEISPEWHLRMQAAVQRNVDAAVSKTINLPASTTIEDIRNIYLAAWKAKVKGITVYRYGCREGQVLTFAAPQSPIPQADSEFSGGCAGRTCEF
ncbi:ribonucleoside-diphosphate reductase, adenosylcobalamin-dependent [Mycobacterium heckeshornense]|nr:adenosylcobalamin-dependent ribonucleoside-diphosphate reductase [Mycobacterium heckeshornense]KMV20933.1 ribonucleoside-diphosphate reductase [Mycobacterium heckeshornense]MCV7034945.1 adenosylcobalamin-dependent ribonucleoside-diphosphate reductase [Mycobacterium heckeshornense]PIJ33336.1 ribonucleoside-diphosphate reductase, adenosylcobalamin-dependent [Mycobacterium heckeshornense]